jgi:hypothetical protein
VHAAVFEPDDHAGAVELLRRQPVGDGEEREEAAQRARD